MLFCTAILFSGCADERKPATLYEHFKSNLNTGPKSIRGSLLGFSVKDEKCSILIKIRKFESKTKAKEFYNKAIDFSNYPFMKRSGVWVMYTENFNNKNFLTNESLKEKIEDVFYDW